MIEVRKTGEFAQWLDELRDIQGRARIQARIGRLAAGNPGDVKPVGEGAFPIVGNKQPKGFTLRGAVGELVEVVAA